MNKYLYIYPINILIKGYLSSILFYYSDKNCLNIPNSLFLFLINNNLKSINYINKKYSNKEILKEYIDYLIINKIGTFINYNEVKLYKNDQIEWDYYSIITNAVIEYSKSFDFEASLKALDYENCKNIQIRINNNISLNEVQEIINILNNYSFIYFEFIIPFSIF